MMEHTCQGMTLGDHSKAICTICGSDLSKPSFNELIKAIERVRQLHKPFGLNNEWCDHCEIGQNSGYEWADYPCDTIKALDGLNV
jgi:hypothetical protein